MTLLPYFIYWILNGGYVCVNKSEEIGLCAPSQLCSQKIVVCMKASIVCCVKTSHTPDRRSSVQDIDHNLQIPVTLDRTHDLRKPVLQEKTHDLRQPVFQEKTHDQRQPVLQESTHYQRQPVFQEKAHDQRQPVIQDCTHDQRQRVFQEKTYGQRQTVLQERTHDQRQPVFPERTHDQRKPVVEEKTHDLRQPVHQEPSDLQQLNWLQSVHDLRWPVVEEDDHDLRNFLSLINAFLYSTVPDTDLLTEESYLDSLENDYDKEVIEKEQFSHISKVCGISASNHSARLIGGTDTKYLKWPWMVSLQYLVGENKVHKCGASLLSEIWVITAAHCVDESDREDYFVRVGDYNLVREDELYPYQERSVTRIVMHPKFHPILLEHDLALLRLDSPVTFGPNIIPVCLPRKLGRVEGKTGTVIGWGKLSERRVLAGTLQELHLPVLTNKECEKMYLRAGLQESLPRFFLCAGVAKGGKDACDGDSGGPLLIEDENGRWSIIGIVSWGRICAAPSMPGVYTRVSYHLKWINHVITSYS